MTADLDHLNGHLTDFRAPSGAKCGERMGPRHPTLTFTLDLTLSLNIKRGERMGPRHPAS